VQQATTAAVFLLLQDRIDEAEDVLEAHGCQPNLLNEQPAMTAAAGSTAAPMELQVSHKARLHPTSTTSTCAGTTLLLL